MFTLYQPVRIVYIVTHQYVWAHRASGVPIAVAVLAVFYRDRNGWRVYTTRQDIATASYQGALSLRLELFAVAVLRLHACSSADGLQLNGDNATLALETLSAIVCPACPSCSGSIYLIYDDETTSSILYNANESEIESALLGLSTLGSASVYGEVLSVNVTMAGGSTLCDSSAQVSTTIRVRCPYGNLPSFTFIGSVRDADGLLAPVTFSDGNGDKENEYCANHGVCNFETGTCLCDRNTTNFPDEWYWWESSDGYGGPGGRPDCGYQRIESTTNVSQGCPVGVVFTDETTPTYETIDKASRAGGSEGTQLNF